MKKLASILCLKTALLLALTGLLQPGYSHVIHADSMVTTSEPVRHLVDTNNPIAIAHQQIRNARDLHSDGEIALVQAALKKARESLQDETIEKDSKTREEVEKLIAEIQRLETAMVDSEGTHEGTISRLWHRSRALVGREVERLSRSWKENNNANMTLKHMIDARLHFFYAEHELLVSHNKEKIQSELDKTVAYLNDAGRVATPGVRQQIMEIRQDILSLSESQTEIAREEQILQALDQARQAIDLVSHSVSDELQIKSQQIVTAIAELSKDVMTFEKKQKYNGIMKRMQDLDQLI